MRAVTTPAVRASAKSGIGIVDILESIVKYVPPPAPDTGGPFRALIFDTVFDAYRGVIVFFRVVDGEITKGDKVRFLASRAEHDVTEVGIMQPHQVPVGLLRAGEVGYLCGAIKDVLDARVGDTISLAREYKAAAKELEGREAEGEEEPIPSLPGYSESVPMVFCGVFPVDADEYEKLRDALGKMRLNDAAITYEPETSGAMGFGFRCGFLGLLHMVSRCYLTLRCHFKKGCLLIRCCCCPGIGRRAGTAGARVRPRPDRHGALGGLPGGEGRGRGEDRRHRGHAVEDARGSAGYEGDGAVRAS